MNGLEIVRGLVDRGYTPYQAAALAGHILQESGGNPSALNQGEGANGLVQWRLDRWDALQNYAKAQGKPANDPNVQLDFIGHEMRGAEKKAGDKFLATTDLAGASAALKPYIRFGDSSADTRLNNARGLLSQFDPNAPVGALARPADPVSPINPTATSSEAPLPAAPAPTVQSVLANLGTNFGGGQQAAQPKAPDFLPEQQIQMAQPMTSQSSQIAAALARAYGLGGLS